MPHINTVPKNGGSSANKLSRFPRSKFIACFFLVIINVAVNTFITFSENTTDYISEYAEYGYETDYVYNSLEHDAAQHSQTATWRYDSTSFGNNLGTVWQIPTTSVFWSMLNRHIVDFNMQLENCNQRFSSDILGTDNRTALTAILSTKYYIDKPQKNPCIPYGYDFLQETADGNCIYENKYSLPLGYTYNTWFPYEKLHGLNGLQKQEAMLQAIALDKNPVTSLEGKLKSSIQDISYQISAMHNIEWKNGILDVKQENASITLNYQFPTAAERYLRLEGFNINSSGYNEFYISVDSSDFHKNTRIASDVSYYYYGCENYLFNLGYSSQKQGSCIITFPRIGKFRLTDIKLFAQPMDEYPIQVQALRKEPLENITLETNRITGTTDLSGNKILCMSIPYSHGWTAKVDGQPVEILRGNIMFMALPLSAGHHELEFLYCTPGFEIRRTLLNNIPPNTVNNVTA